MTHSLSDFAAQSVITVEVRNPIDGTPLIGKDKKPMSVECYTSDSTEYRGIANELRKGVDLKTDPLAFGNELLAKIIVKSGVYDDTGHVSKERLGKLIASPAYAWLRDQIDAAVHDRVRFFGKPPSD